MLNQIKPIERPSLVETLITQIQYVPDWKKEDFLNEYSVSFVFNILSKTISSVAHSAK